MYTFFYEHDQNNLFVLKQVKEFLKISVKNNSSLPAMQ